METQKPISRALLVGIQLSRVSDVDHQASLAELRRLVDTLGYNVVGSVTQKRSSTSGALVVGEGKLRELAKWTGGVGEVVSAFKKKKSKAAEKFGAVDEDEDETEYEVEAEGEDETENEAGETNEESVGTGRLHRKIRRIQHFQRHRGSTYI